MLDITFMLSPLIQLRDFPLDSKIITSNLEFNKDINPSYNNSIIITNTNFKKEKEILKLNIPPFLQKYLLRRQQYTFNNFVFNNDGIKKFIKESVKTEIIIFSTKNLECLPLIKDLINNGKKIVLIGVFSFFYSGTLIRKALIDIGVNKNNINNIIIIKGYINKETNLLDIINNWKDTIIKENNNWTIYDYTDDFLLNYIHVLKKFEISPELNVCFKQQCSWLKCKYCNHKFLPNINFVKNIDNTINSINKLVTEYKTNKIFIMDSYCSFDNEIKEIMKGINHHKLSIFTGILLLQSIEIIEYINEYVDSICVGLESTIDFTLSFIDKGYTYIDITKAINNIIKYMDKDKTIFFNVIIDLPILNKNDVILNFNRLKEIREKFLSEGFTKFQLNPHALIIEPKSKIIDNNLLRLSKFPIAGENYIISHFKNYPFIPEYISPNFSRFDANGDQVPSDFQLVDTSFLLD